MTATRLFLCNQKKYGEIKQDILEAKRKFYHGESFSGFWTCGNMKNISIDDVAYFLRVGDDKRGVFASGLVTKSPEDGVIGFYWEAVVDFDNTLLTSELLNQPKLIDANFFVRGSGYKLAEQYSRALKEQWEKYVDIFGVRDLSKIKTHSASRLLG